MIVVGLGASEGGFDALCPLFEQASEDCDLAFVTVFHHNAPNIELLREAMPESGPRLVLVEGGERVESGRVYIANAEKLLSISDATLRLHDAADTDQGEQPIDFFFHSLASDQKENAVALVLSGLGSDGASGLKAVSDAGGMTIVQEPGSAHQEAMPHSAIDTGGADHVLTPQHIFGELKEHAQFLRSRSNDKKLQDGVLNVMPEICDLLLKETGLNFRHYKSSTLLRRVIRRLQVLHLDSGRDYVEYLRVNATEGQRLFRDLLVNVTSFFRDPDAFEALRDVAFPKLFDGKKREDVVRIWVAGCATGEEAYSIAMLAREYLDELKHPPQVQVFATDIDEHSLSFARQGAYAAGIVNDLSAQRLERFFEKKRHLYHVKSSIRDMCLFSVHNLINDPPFSKLDMLSCRNLLIYLGSHLQNKLIPLFHFALRPGGILFLGPSENIASHGELFRSMEARHRISQRLPTAVRSTAGLAISKGPATAAARPPNTPSSDDLDVYVYMQRVLLDEFAPKGVVINEDGGIVCASGNLEQFLGLSPGAFHNNVVRLARPELRVPLRAAINDAAKHRRKCTRENINLSGDESSQNVSICVQPMPQLGDDGGLFLVVFDVSTRETGRVDAEPASPDTAQVIDELEEEVRSVRAELEKTVQELEAANEELKASNEELLSMNEELQSANDELQASHGELQSLNESLVRANDDVENLLASTQIATIFLDPARKMRRMTPAASAIFNVQPQDIGRPLADFTHHAIDMPELPDYASVLESEEPVEDEIGMDDGVTYLRRVTPYKAQSGEAHGLVVTFVDISEQQEMQERLRDSEGLYRAIGESIDYGVWVCDPEGNNVYVSQSFLDLVGRSLEECREYGWTDLLHEDDREATVQAWKECVANGSSWNMEHRYRGADGQWHDILARGVPVRDPEGNIKHWAGINLDITQMKATQQALLETDARKDEFMALLAHELRNPLAAIVNANMLADSDGSSMQTRRWAHEVIQRQSRQLTRLIDDLLDLSRISSGKVTLRMEHLDVNDVLRLSAESIDERFTQKQQSFTLDLQDVPLTVNADPARLQQVFVNLLTNASKYTGPEGSITVSSRKKAETAVIRITDTGTGIKHDQLTRIFEPFAQFDDSEETAASGLGLGLSVVKSLVEQHGGYVHASSDGPGRGSMFEVGLPVADSQGQAVELPQAFAQAFRATGSRRVLLVEDSADNAQMMATLLTASGHEVRIADNGIDAVTVARQFRPEAVLLDLGLPGKDGFAVARELRSQDETADSLIIAVSGYGQQADMDQSREAGADHHIVKPADLQAILALVESGRPSRG